MRRTNTLHLCLSLVATVGLSLFILACTGWNGWSPDGGQVVFGYYDSDASEYHIAIYDIKGGRVRSLNPQELRSDGDHWLSAQWKKDGTGLWVFKEGPNKTFLLMDVSANDGEILETFEIPVSDSDSVPLGDAVELNGNLFLNIRPLTRVDLISKKIEQLPDEEEDSPFVFSWGEGRLAYLSSGSEHHPKLGFLDPQTLAKNPLFTFEPSDPRLRGAEDLHPLLGADPTNARIALTTVHRNREDIVICDPVGIQKVLRPRLPYSEFHLGVPIWSRDGKRILLSGMTPQNDDWSLVFLADVDVETGRTKSVPIAPIKTEGDDFYKSFYFLAPVSLSPDGNTAAISMAGVEKNKVRQSDRALYLVDLTSDKSKLTKIPYPVSKTKK